MVAIAGTVPAISRNCCTALPYPLVARTENVVVPLRVGVPEIVPPGLSERRPGSALPAARAKVIEPSPVAAIRCEKGTPTGAGGSAIVSNTGTVRVTRV